RVICGPPSGSVPKEQSNCRAAGAIQFAEHTSATSVRTFAVNWTAPASAVGTVRFNVAGNSANGNGKTDGDHIYTKVYPVAPAVDLSTHAFTMVDRGGVSIITDGSGPQASGYSRIVPDSGQTTPTGVAIFG